jgi:hypothetical protein
MYTCIWIFREVIPESVECTVYDASAAAYRIGPIIKMHSLTLVCESSDIRKCDPADPTNSKLVLLYEELMFNQYEPMKILQFACIVSTLLTDRSSIAQSRHIDCMALFNGKHILSHMQIRGTAKALSLTYWVLCAYMQNPDFTSMITILVCM